MADAAPGAHTAEAVLEACGLSVHYGTRQVLHEIELRIPRGTLTALIGPSGCGKSTLLRCFNRLHDVNPGVRVEGEIRINGYPVSAWDPVALRRRVGMVFQRPNPFPGRSVFENIALPLRVSGVRGKRALAQRVEQALQAAALWDEVKDRLHQPAQALSGGQQQRLCIARALALEPQVLLLDEPTSALDPVSTQRIESLLQELKSRCTLILVTHHLGQARRLAEHTVLLDAGRIVEQGPTEQLFEAPSDPRTAAYLSRAE
ncbi:MAG: phosphate ABC transporter ATP-binding protein [Alicyclobacillus sp.]|nr:phosphate ABC transporter ATP-binding protein [Alicyclobacillus sp.]